jgi:hypothetical protein
MLGAWDQFKKGDPLLNFGASPAAVVAYEQAKTTLRLAQGTRDRTMQMVKLKLATADQLDMAEKAVSDAQLEVLRRRSLLARHVPAQSDVRPGNPPDGSSGANRPRDEAKPYEAPAISGRNAMGPRSIWACGFATTLPQKDQTLRSAPQATSKFWTRGLGWLIIPR